jgi:hypothetical protein
MRKQWWLGMVAGIALGACAGCDDGSLEGADMKGAEPGIALRYNRSRAHRVGPDASSESGTSTATGNGTGEGCAICDRASACCHAVAGGPLCTFSATTCSSLPPSPQQYYINACRELLATAARAHRSQPVAACF